MRYIRLGLVLIVSLPLINANAGVFARSKRFNQDILARGQTDLTGNYLGIVHYPAGGLDGDATLTIVGNEFSLMVGTATLNGRIVANTTGRYVAVALQIDGTTSPTILSLRAFMMNGRLQLTSAVGEKREFLFKAQSRFARHPRRRKPARRRIPEGELITPVTESPTRQRAVLTPKRVKRTDSRKRPDK